MSDATTGTSAFQLCTHLLPGLEKGSALASAEQGKPFGYQLPYSAVDKYVDNYANSLGILRAPFTGLFRAAYKQ
ncbi:hypothetical protein [Hymenobacter bucti]|uniref:hypothetical protein n=1 Tax=Hymenobacter bucti TaxID=1844114 RepID=UPI0036426E35